MCWILLARSVKIRNHFFVDFPVTPERVQREMSDLLVNRRENDESKRKREVYLFVDGGGWYCSFSGGANLTLTHTPPGVT